MRLLSHTAILGAVGLATAGTIGAISTVSAHSGGQVPQRVAAEAAAAPTSDSIMETFEYPEAAEILARDKVKLISGDGHILIAKCETPPEGDLGLIEVRTSATGVSKVCFKVHGNTGLLNLEVPAVFEIRGDGLRKGAGHNITAIVETEDGKLPPVKVNPSGSTGVGIGDPNIDKEAILLQLKVTP